MKSMTGFGHRETQDDARHVVLELRCYNNRYLDINVNLPPGLGPMEPRLRKYLAARLHRGKADLTVRLRSLTDEVQYAYNRSAMRSLAELLNDVIATTGIDDSVHLADLLKVEDIVRAPRSVETDRIWNLLLPLLEEVYQEFDAGRKQEGENAKLRIAEHLTIIDQAVDLFRTKDSGLAGDITRDLQARFDQVLGDRVDSDRLLAETAVLLMKFGIDEEITRIAGHLDAFRQTMEICGTIGKKLDFLCQELQREINTIGSKSTDYELSRMVVEAKDAVEKIREQLRNVE